MQHYLISDNGQTKGPYTIIQLRSMWHSGAVTGDTLYCEEGSDVWLHLRVLEKQLEGQLEEQDTFSVSAPARKIVVRSDKNRGVYIILGIFLLTPA